MSEAFATKSSGCDMKLVTEAGLEGKLNLGTDQGSAWHQLETGFVNDHYYCTWHLVDGTPNAKCKSEHDTLKDRVAKVLNKSFDYDPKRAWELSALWGNMEIDFPHYKKFLSKLWVDKEKLCKYFRRTFTRIWVRYETGHHLSYSLPDFKTKFMNGQCAPPVVGARVMHAEYRVGEVTHVIANAVIEHVCTAHVDVHKRPTLPWECNCPYHANSLQRCERAHVSDGPGA
jgi:hypothetical protein